MARCNEGFWNTFLSNYTEQIRLFIFYFFLLHHHIHWILYFIQFSCNFFQYTFLFVIFISLNKLVGFNILEGHNITFCRERISILFLVLDQVVLKVYNHKNRINYG